MLIKKPQHSLDEKNNLGATPTMKKFLAILVMSVLTLTTQFSQAGVTYYHNDVLGSPTVITNESAQVVSRSHEKPFGSSIEGVTQDVGYTGHQHDADLGLTYMQARYYDPVIGRFYSNDPLGFSGEIDTFNRYSYVANNPYKYIDPNGEEKYGIEINLKAAFRAGGVLSLGVMYDTDHHEIVLTGTGGVSSGLAAKGGIAFVKPSSPESISGVVSGDVYADLILSAEAGPLGGEVSLLTGETSNSAAAEFNGSGVRLNGGVDLTASAVGIGEGKLSLPNVAKAASDTASDVLDHMLDAADCWAGVGEC